MRSRTRVAAPGKGLPMSHKPEPLRDTGTEASQCPRLRLPDRPCDLLPWALRRASGTGERFDRRTQPKRKHIQGADLGILGYNDSIRSPTPRVDQARRSRCTGRTPASSITSVRSDEWRRIGC